jgi:hypothetical protein
VPMLTHRRARVRTHVESVWHLSEALFGRSSSETRHVLKSDVVQGERSFIVTSNNIFTASSSL